MIKVHSKGLACIEWGTLMKVFQEHSQSEFGREYFSNLNPELYSATRARSISTATQQMNLVLSHWGEEMPLASIPDIRPILKRMERLGDIDLAEFFDLVVFLKCVHGQIAFGEKRYKEYPELKKLCFGLKSLKSWSDQYFQLIDARGDMRDSASKDLLALRMLVKKLKTSIQNRLDEYVKNRRYGKVLQDQYVTLRDGRFVLPVKSDFKGQLKGIIHDVSRTESTVFVEPHEIVEWNNQLLVATKEIDEEIKRILRAVVVASRPDLPDFWENCRCLGLLDGVNSIAKAYSSISQSHVCVANITDEANSYICEKLFHPLLLINSQNSIVPHSFDWNSSFIVSGPNTGGKTVLLKSVALSVAMAHSGIPVLAQGLTVPLSAKQLFVDVGDEQDLQHHLSTFSAHLLNIKSFLDQAEKGDMVFIDEICTGTSPEEGDKMACSIVEEFIDREISTFVTTHYSGLKNFAMSHEGCRIAAMAFDHVKRLPLYELLLDMPGDSSAVDVAKRLGLDEAIISRVEKELGPGHQELNAAIERFDNARKSCEAEKRDLEEKIKASEQARKQFEIREKDLRKKIQEKVKEESQNILTELNEMRTALSKKIKDFEHDVSRGNLNQKLGQKKHQVFNQLGDLATKTRAFLSDQRADYLESQKILHLEELEVGTLVRVKGLGLGTVEELPPKKAKAGENPLVSIKIGTINTRVSLDKLFSATAQEQKNVQQKKEHQQIKENKSILSGAGAKKSSSSSQRSKICDVRGLSVDQAMNRVNQLFNELTRGDCGSVTIVHGHGGEKLKSAIRSYLNDSRPDLSFRTGSWPGEGGDGVTIVEL